MTRRIGGAGGGSDPGKRGGGFIVAIAIAIAISGGGAATTAGTALTPGASVSVNPPGGGARGNARVSGRNSAATEARLTRQGLRVRARVAADTTDCAANSYGRVRQFFRKRPCVAMHRAQFELRDRNGDVVLVPVSWVEMPDEAGARALKQLVDTDGTGNITELSRERGRYRSVGYNGAVYASRRDENVFINAQAQPVARRWAGAALTSVANNAVQ